MKRYVNVTAFGTSAWGGGAPQAPVGLHNGAIESLPFGNALKTWTPPWKSRIWTDPKVTASVVGSTLNIDTATYTRSVERNVFVFCVYAESEYVSIRGNCRMYPSVSVTLMESVVLNRVPWESVMSIDNGYRANQ